MNFGARQVRLLVKQSMHALEPDIERTIRKHREQGFGWRYDGLGDWTTEAIIDKLRELGVNTSAEEFLEQARSAGRCAVLEAKWVHNLKFEGFWADFPFLAAEELWERLTPDLLCPETLSNHLEAVVGRSRANRGRLISEEEERAEVDMATAVAEYLEGFPKEDRPAWFKDIVDCGTCDYGSWLLELVLNSGPRFPTEITYVANIMSDCEHAENYQGDLALALAIAGRREEALDLVDANLERFPDRVWTRIMAGDVCKELHELGEAVHLYTEAMPMATNPYEWDAIEQRFVPLLERMGRDAEWELLKKRHPRPSRAATETGGGPLPRPQTAPPAAAERPIGVITSGPAPRIVSVPAPTSGSRQSRPQRSLPLRLRSEVQEVLPGAGLNEDNHEEAVREARSIGTEPSDKPRYTPRQGQMLAFIYYYTKIHKCPPAEADIAAYFGVSPPSAHQAIMTLERQG